MLKRRQARAELRSSKRPAAVALPEGFDAKHTQPNPPLQNHSLSAKAS